MGKVSGQKRVWYLNGGVPGFDLNSLPRCQAIAKSFDRRCRNPAMKGSDLCCVHAGLKKPGARPGNRNALKHGLHTKEALEQKEEVRSYIKEMEDFLDGILA
jgi:glucans biosynthesis protein